MKNQLVFVSRVSLEDIKTEDGGQAKIATLSPDQYDTASINSKIFVRLHSWSDDKTHPELDALIKPGKEYIVHIEQVED